MFRTLLCSSSGVQIVLVQHLVSGIVTLFRCLFSEQIKRGLLTAAAVSKRLLTCALNRHLKRVTIPDTRCYTDIICPPEDEHNSARNM